MWDMIVSVPDNCLSLYFIKTLRRVSVLLASSVRRPRLFCICVTLTYEEKMLL